jgi:hypothetical protein
LTYTNDNQSESDIKLKKSDKLVNEKWLYRVGGISALIIGIAYVIIIVLYVLAGVPPTGGEAWLKYLAGRTTEWWIIIGLSVLTDFLFVPVMLALYHALNGINRHAVWLATALFGLFIVLDLGVTWPNYSSLVHLSGNYAAATNEGQRAISIATANYASAILTSPILSLYIILVPALSILMIGLVMLKGVFSKTTAYLGLITGVLGIVSVVGPLLVSVLGLTVILASVLTLVWCLFVGHRLYKLGQS